MTLSLPLPAILLALLGRDSQPAPVPAREEPPPQNDCLRQDIGLPPEPAAPSTLTIALRARGDL